MLNFKEEYRPKLYRRLRTFTWIDPIHETVRLDPVVFDSDIAITHLPQSLHSSRDFKGFLLAFDRDGRLSKIVPDVCQRAPHDRRKDFIAAAKVFLATLRDETASGDARKGNRLYLKPLLPDYRKCQ